jgi:phenylacetate-coenzyme A ligase PaaK-like adenylate-forming protein
VDALELFRRTAATVPAYQEFLREQQIEPDRVKELTDVPLMTKENYHTRYPLPMRCRNGRLEACDMIANVYPENIAAGLEQPGVSDWVTGKFVLEAGERLAVAVELAPGRTGDASLAAEAILGQLRRLNSEFAHYVPAGYQLPLVSLYPAGDPEYFPRGVKHRYTRSR